MTPTNNLWALNGQIFELLEAREEALANVESVARSTLGGEEDAARAELRAIEAGIVRFIEEKVSEVTDLRAAYFALSDAAAIATAESKRAQNRAILMESRAMRLKELIKGCMQTLGKKRLDSAMGSFLVRGNGGAQPVEITDESLVPDDYRRITVTMPLNLWMERGCSAFSGCEIKTSFSPEISKSAIAEALQQPCQRCDGNGICGEAWGELDEDAEYRPAENPCKACGGTGKQGVPGARFAERGTSLQIK